jgi:hypothetical protein
MVHDLWGTLKIALVVLLATLAMSGMVGFYEGRQAAKAAVLPVFYLASFIGALQAIATEYVPWLLLLYAMIAVAAVFTWRRRRTR